MVEVPEPGDGIGFGLKLTVVPDGTPEADKLMALLKPPPTFVVMVEIPWLPCGTVSKDGEAEIVKVACTATVRVTVVVCWMPPPFAVTVIGYVPGAVLIPTVIVIVELPEPGIGIG